MSIKALEIAEEKEAVAQYGSTDSGASLGDILGAALKARQEPAKRPTRTRTPKSSAAAKHQDRQQRPAFAGLLL